MLIQKIYLYFFILNSILISLLSGFFSVIGFGLIFKNILISISILAILLETSKIFISVYLHLFWRKANKLIIFYLIVSLIILSLINSLGVFSYLSKGFLDSFNSSEINFQIDLSKEQIDTKKEIINSNKELKKEKEIEKKRLLNELYLYTDIDKNEIRNKIKKINNEIEELNKQNEKIFNEISEIKKTEFFNKTEINKIENEIGFLKYLALLIYKENSKEIIEKSMRIFIVILIIVFDPLALISLIACISALKNLNQNKEKNNEENLKKEERIKENEKKNNLEEKNKINILNTTKDKLDELYNFKL